MRKIFIVEDDPAIREVLEIVLSSENYEVQLFSNVSEFSERDVLVDPDLFIFDVMLPDGSGIDLCGEIKRKAIRTNIPVIIMSAHAQLKNIRLVCKPDYFISKPFDIDQLILAVQQTILK